MMAHMNFGIGVARRAWVTAANVLNTWKLEELLKWAQQKSKK
jgi:histidinol phosphatase-like PHP family hydrolase